MPDDSVPPETLVGLCPGDSTKAQGCNAGGFLALGCPMWAPWKSASCSVTCGRGTKTHHRSCVGPHLEAVESTLCSYESCGENCETKIVNCKSSEICAPQWGEWSEWADQCTVPCGTGETTRTRVCCYDDECQSQLNPKCSNLRGKS